MFIDTHAHLTDILFDNDIEKVLKHSYELGVDFIITSGFNLSSSLKAVEFANKYKNVFASVGIYPEYAEEADALGLAKLEEMAKDGKVVAIGEIGMQFTEGAPKKEIQKKAFLMQLELAYKLKKPVIIHCREAIGDMIEILNQNKNLLEFGGTMHCFSGSKESAFQLIKLGLNISVGGVSTFKNAQNLKETLKVIPLDKILLETDCPYLTPHPFRGKRNSPEFIPTIAENLAKLKGISVEEVAVQTSLNAQKLFCLGGRNA